MDKFFRRTEAIRKHIFESTFLGQANHYRKTLKKITEYAGKNFKSNGKESIKTLKIPVLDMPNNPMPHTTDNKTEVSVTET